MRPTAALLDLSRCLTADPGSTMAYQSLEQCRTATTKTPDAIKAPELLKRDAEWYDTHPRLQQQYRRPCRRITACRRSSLVTVRGDGSHGIDDHRKLVIDGADSVNSDAHECLLFFPIIGILQDGCWAVKLSIIWQLLWQPREKYIDHLPSARRDSPGSVPLP